MYTDQLTRYWQQVVISFFILKESYIRLKNLDRDFLSPISQIHFILDNRARDCLFFVLYTNSLEDHVKLMLENFEGKICNLWHFFIEFDFSVGFHLFRTRQRWQQNSIVPHESVPDTLVIARISGKILQFKWVQPTQSRIVSHETCRTSDSTSYKQLSLAEQDNC